MLLSAIYNDSNFIDSKIPEGYILIFYSLDENGNIVKRYKDSNGNFGNLGGSGKQDITDEVAKEQIIQITNEIEESKQEIYVKLVEATAISNQLDQIIGE